MSRILVTGGCGFIGANLVRELRRLGHEVLIVDDFSRGSAAYLDDPAAYILIRADVRDAAALQGAMQGVQAVVHLAALGSVVESVAAPQDNFSVNVTGTFAVLDAARRASVRRVVFASTGGAVIGNAEPPVSEASLPRPISPYGASKLAGEGYCSAFAHAYDLPVTALRFANVLGPLSWHKKGALSAFFQAILEGRPMRIFGDGSATRDFLYVGDLCRGIIAALDSRPDGFQLLHLASGREVAVRELARLAGQAAGAPHHPIVFAERRKGEVERNFASYAAAEKALGWRPQVTLEEALAATWAWFSQHAARHPEKV